MKDEQFTEIAKRLDISKSTVSKAYRHCSGVDTSTRERVLQETANFTSHDAVSPGDIYCILPDTPQYFWNELRRGIRAGEKETGMQLNYNIITRISDTNTVLYYLDEAKRLGVKAVLLASVLTPAIRECLSGFPSDVRVILLSEYDTLDGGYYVGADPYADGALMGRLFAERYGEHRPIILHKPHRPNIDGRIAGFRDTIARLAPQSIDKIRTVTVPADFFISRKTAPSRLAALLKDCVGDGEPPCLYAPFGSVQLPLALNKARLSDRVVTLCHDDVPDSPGLPELAGAILRQDLFTQGKCAVAMGAALLSPNATLPEGNTFIPSQLTIRP